MGHTNWVEEGSSIIKYNSSRFKNIIGGATITIWVGLSEVLVVTSLFYDRL